MVDPGGGNLFQKGPELQTLSSGTRARYGDDVAFITRLSLSSCCVAAWPGNVKLHFNQFAPPMSRISFWETGNESVF